MILSEGSQAIKECFEKFINGDFDDKFSSDQIKMAIESGFILNHIRSEGFTIIFEYGNSVVRLNKDEFPQEFEEETLLTIFKNNKVVKSSLKSFIRDFKINKILK